MGVITSRKWNIQRTICKAKKPLNDKFLIYLTYITCSFETSDGTFRNEKGGFRQDAVLGPQWSVVGAYGYVGADGIVYKTEYLSDENGYRITKQSP